MAFLSADQILELTNKMSADPSLLGKIYKSKKKTYLERTVDHNLVEGLRSDGWEEYGTPLKTKTKIRKPKSHFDQFEDDLWCQLYDLGFRHLNIDRNFNLPYGKLDKEKKQIDIVAVNSDTVLLIECKSSEKPKKAPSFKTEFEALGQRLNGHKKAVSELFGSDKKTKFILATRNFRLSRESIDVKRLEEKNGFFYNDNTFDYVDRLIRSYKSAAQYQFLGMIFKGQSINSEKISVPAIEGKMGKKTYYMFSLEPRLLLKLGFVLHRTQANESEMPTYQRLLVPARLKGIGKFIDSGGYFPNSVILNFNELKRQKISFEASARGTHSNSRAGVLKIPNAYAIAYIIDGQHRVYGYSQSDFKDTNTIPVVAFKNLASSEQLEMFMDINQNQKAVSPTLRITLEEDLYWEAPRLDSRLKALRSSIVSALGGDQAGPLYGKIALGEDKSLLSAKPFADALLRCGLIPEAKGNRFVGQEKNSSLYNTDSLDHAVEMKSARNKTVAFLNACYEYAEEFFNDDEQTLNTFIVYNRGTYAFISLIGSLNKHLTQINEVDVNTPVEIRLDAHSKYLRALFEALAEINQEDKDHLLGKLGSGAEITWFKMFQNFVNHRFEEYEPADLLDWRERLDQELQSEGRALANAIERHLKKVVIGNLKVIYGKNWDIEIGAIQRECEKRAKEQMERSYKEGLGRNEIEWTDMFGVSDYKKIIEKYWGKTPASPPAHFKTFEQHFAFDIGEGSNSKAEKLKWLSYFGSYRNTLAHEGTREKGLNLHEVEFLRNISGRIELSDKQPLAS
ncbi:DGQHR domain-containing protein [Sulfitobacter litoralis]|uniref:DGQHR domain-containing protein n=1 Tax=Sulfitobacter litoralis TaxID=335975 RepID=UPI002B266F45|nr:DGQHR domain-containing protein [Sulfitobacter litoralis]